VHTRGNSEYGNKRMERLKISESKREIRKEKEREKEKGNERVWERWKRRRRKFKDFIA